MIEFKSAEVLNQPEPHAKKAVAALRRAFDRGWEDREPMDYAKFLENLGGMTNSKNNRVLQPLADLQLEQLNELYEDAVVEYAIRQKVKPGISGWAQVNGWRGETDNVDKLRGRVQHDIYYIENWSVFLELQIILRTIATIFKGTNAY